MQNIDYKIVLFLLIFLTGTVFSGTRENFLSHGPSVQAYGRGETGTASFDDVSSAYYNPSLLGEAKTSGMILSEDPLFDGTAYSYAGINSAPSKKNTAFGFSMTNLRSGDVEIRQNINDSPSVIHTNQWAAYLTFARRFKKLFALNMGVSIKYVYYDMYNHTGGGLGADLGVSKVFSGPRIFGNQSQLNTGLSVLNAVPPSIKLISEAEQLGAIYRFGGSISMPVFYRTVSHDTVSIFADFNEQENMLNPAFGAEYCFCQKYTLRAGYYKDKPTAGASVGINNFRINYAADFGSLDTLNRFSVAFDWGGGKTRKRKQKAESLIDEARQALRENELDSERLDREVNPLFKDALKDYKKQRYLLSADKFRNIILKYPQCENAGLYYQKITDEMNDDSQRSTDSDFEKVSYAKGYVNYRGQKYTDAQNEWEKVLQMNPKRTELEQYLAQVREYLHDVERIKKEKEIEGRVSKLFEEGKSSFEAKKWVACVKTMEKVKDICKNEPFPSSFDWNAKAQTCIDDSVAELAKIAMAVSKSKGTVKEAEKLPEQEIDVQGADKKYNEGLILYAQGKVADAVRMWEIAIRLNPGHEKAGKALEKTREEIDLKRNK